MAMGMLIMATVVLAGLNTLLLLPLVAVWIRNYNTFGTGLVGGLVLFAVAMLAENAMAIYFFFSMASFYGGGEGVQEAVLVLRTLQFIAIAALSYTTLK
jgi:hypothetical protein